MALSAPIGKTHGSIHRAPWPTEQEVRGLLGDAPDAAAERALEYASEATALIRRERALKKLAFGVPVAALRVPPHLEPEWRAIAADVLAGNNARDAQVSFGEDVHVTFATPAGS